MANRDHVFHFLAFCVFCIFTFFDIFIILCFAHFDEIDVYWRHHIKALLQIDSGEYDDMCGGSPLIDLQLFFCLFVF